MILFEKLGLDTVKKTKTGYTTSAEVLEKLRDKHVNFRRFKQIELLVFLQFIKELFAEQRYRLRFSG